MHITRSALLLAMLAGCVSPDAEPEFSVTESAFGAGAATAPVILVARPHDPLTREDWAISEQAARDYCAERGLAFDLQPASDRYTQVSYEDGEWSFVAACLPAV
ncbi:hypothetical protein V8J82_03280 [Gymnodinialimonas sp. 2305UL16-5]|uniref:hypothetical protein n=1 Tax=Gymnodinialimonas mytili TaxID=3126503 RepID=UPI0030A30A86